MANSEHYGKVRSWAGYGILKGQVLKTVDRLGRFNATPVSLFKLDYPDLAPTHQRALTDCINEYGLSGYSLVAIQDALFREVFNSRTENRFGIAELKYSQLKAQLTRWFMTADPFASLGIGNIKAFRITNAVYEHLPLDIQKKLLFDNQSQHVQPASLATFLNTGDIYLQYQRTCMIYGATFAVHQSAIEQWARITNPTDWQKRYIASVIMCCSDPLTAESTPQNVAYDNGFMLLKDPEFARRHFKDSEQLILARQNNADSFFTSDSVMM
ncbi:hypothetical protein A3F03_04375 [Candidatus Roizmanbacteria bacterium RIFCSPHIGHO2_12_FULL_41_11]|uniref:Uncharacterized protein n=2 Tax=Candidatus Roizmaniibacteriota TaxID=1752723 RepID=A0A1F7J9B2_9BACT|nr:MAG: hypothetical protein A3F03_04375 [Candidatus Roizmanbacteria bacterium RIFCSPHIGHO2_12_FULL_41_11]OGK52166.1 MAG: hypothetical protein A2966_02075 [Candidatus Roizmanbacteria bacterium RIFCSPLOWO2_01_FULL_41_22]